MKPVIYSAFIILLLLNGTSVCAQLQNGECGIRYSYDAAGNRTKRDYICNNTGLPINSLVRNDSLSYTNNLEKTDEGDIMKVNELYPNPTSGIFTVILAGGVKDGSAFLHDEKGNLIEQRKVTGSQLTFDLSRKPSGIYFLKIQDHEGSIQMKIIKL